MIDSLALAIAALGLGGVVGAVGSGWVWCRHHRAVMAQCRDDHRRQIASLLGHRRSAFVAVCDDVVRSDGRTVVRPGRAIGRN